MNKSLFNILGIAILIMFVITTVVTLTGIIPGKTGDLIIMGSSFIIAVVAAIFLRKKKNDK